MGRKRRKTKTEPKAKTETKATLSPFEEAVTRLDELYKKCVEANDVKTSLQIAKEKNKLLSLHGSTGPEGNICEDCEVASKLELIKGHILPCKLVDDHFPIEEHVRVAASNAFRYKILKNEGKV